MMSMSLRSLQSVLGLMGLLALFLAMVLPREAVAGKVAFTLVPAAEVVAAGPLAGDAPDGLATMPPTASVPPEPRERIARASWIAAAPLPRLADWLRPASRASPERS